MPPSGSILPSVFLAFSFAVVGLPALGGPDPGSPVQRNPLVGVEFGIDQTVEGPSPCTRAAPSVAMGESGSLMVWTHGKGPSTEPAVYAARLAADGTLLDPYGILISKSAGEQTVGAAAANPGGYLVVWSAPHGSSTTDWDVLGARLRTDGTLQDPVPLTICALATTFQAQPAVAANGTNYLVAWRDSRSTGIYGTLVFPDGSILATNGFAICTAANDQYAPAVAALGTNYLAVWQDYRKATSSKYVAGVFGARISGSGAVIDTNGIAISTPTNSVYHPTVAGRTSEWLVAWEAYDPGGNAIYGARLNQDGTVLDPGGFVISHAGNLQASPVVTATGEGYLAAWEDYRGTGTNAFVAAVYGTLIGSDGTVTDANGIPLSSGSGSQCKPAVAAHGHEAVVLWQDFRNNPDTVLSDIYGVRLDFTSNALVGPAFAATRTVNAQWRPVIAPCGTNLLVVWADNRQGAASGSRIYGARLTAGGTILDGTPISIGNAPNRQSDPAVASNGGLCLVTWSRWPDKASSSQVADIYGSLVNESGQVLEPDGIPISTAADDQTLPAASPLGAGFLVVWQDARNRGTAGTHQDVYGARVSLAGTVLDPDGIAIAKDTTIHLTPAVAANGSQALVVWTQSRTSTVSDIYGARLDDTGKLIDTAALPVCRAANLQLTPTVAANGNGYFVAWADRRSGPANSDIYGAVVRPDGQVQPTDGSPLRSGPGNQLAPALVAQGSDYFVVWQEPRASRPDLYDLWGAWVSHDGIGTSSPPIVIARDFLDHARSAVAVGAAGPVLVVSQAMQYSAARVAANSLDLQAWPRLHLATASGDGRVTLILRGAPGRHYTMETSADLAKWEQVDTMVLATDSLSWSDPNATRSLQAFYRVVLQP